MIAVSAAAGKMTGSATMGRPLIDRVLIDEAKVYLVENAVCVNPFLKDFFSRKRKEWSALGEIVSRAADVYDGLTCDGKKIRAALVKLGYDACRHESSPVSPKPEGIFQAAGSVEILHNAFLIHDDIVDHSDLRRSAPTVHKQIASAARPLFGSEAEALEYGAAVALNYGDTGQALAQELLIASGFPDRVLLKAVKLLSDVTIETVTGQLLDVEHVPLADLTEDLVLKIHEFKTAHYTVMLPLMMGATLADASDEVLAGIRSYAIPIGIAFQIQDDSLGLYGDESILGKPVDSDVKEGKKTLLFVHAYKEASPADQEFLRRVHGNPELLPGDLDRVRAIVTNSGALAKSEAFAKELVEKGRPFIPAISQTEQWQRILGGLADYFISRHH